MKISITIQDLEILLKEAKKKYNRETNSCVEIRVVKPAKYHGDSDKIEASLQSGWAECNSHHFYSN